MILIDTQKEEFNKLKHVRIFSKVENENRFNGDLLVIGLGGVGGKVVTALKRMMMGNISREDNISFLLMDSDIPAMEATIKDSKEGYGLNALEVLSIYRPNLGDILTRGFNSMPVQESLAKWMSPDFPRISIGTTGAEGNRQIGRLMFSNAYEDMRILLFEKLEDLYSKSKGGKLDVIIVSSTAGGTGSGILADVTYNIKAYGKSRRWKNFRVGGCLITPDALFANKAIYDNEDKRTLLLANSHATREELSQYMQIAYTGESYNFESTTHRLTMKENIFDSCVLVSGKKDDQGYIPEHVVFNDVAYFLQKLAINKYIDDSDINGNRMLIRDSFFESSSVGLFKVVNESDYKIPIREIENICEQDIFSRAEKLLYEMPEKDESIKKDVDDTFGELKTFFAGEPGDEINLSVNGLIKVGQYSKQPYKAIKKGTDDFSTILPRQLETIKTDIPVIVKSIRIKLTSTLDGHIDKYLRQFGPFVTMKMIGARNIGGCEEDGGMIQEIKSLETALSNYSPFSEFERIRESILAIVKKRFFTFPNAKKETENGYYEASIKDALAKERNMLMEEMNRQDVLGDIIRQLRHRAEQLDDIYSQFGVDLNSAISGLSNDGRRIIGFMLKQAKRTEFLPKDYITDEKVEQMKTGLINFMVSHESDLDNDRLVPVSQEMERIYKNFFNGVGVYAPEKLIYNAFADEQPTMSECNFVFVGKDNDQRRAIMKKAAKAFVDGAFEKTKKKKLCELVPGFENQVLNKKFISLPESMPFFSQAVKEILIGAPYNEDPDAITMNPGEMQISVDNFYMGIRPSMLACAEEMKAAYDKVISGGNYYGLHADESPKQAS